MITSFSLDPRLERDTFPVATLELCQVRLMNDSRFPWLVLVPQCAEMTEVDQLSDPDQARLWREVRAAGASLREAEPCDKLNIGALGNIVRQLHVHVVARRVGDHAWPGPVWGHGRAVPYEPDSRDALIERLQQRLATK